MESHIENARNATDIHVNALRKFQFPEGNKEKLPTHHDS
jgi:hypothetical protein